MAKMIDLGRKTSPITEAKPSKNKVYYPSFTVDKDLGLKIGDNVMAYGTVVGLRKDKYGNSTSVEMKRMSAKKVSDKDFEKMSDKQQEDYLEGQK